MTVGLTQHHINLIVVIFCAVIAVLAVLALVFRGSFDRYRQRRMDQAGFVEQQLPVF